MYFKMSSIPLSVVLIVLTVCVFGDEIDMEVQSNSVMKMMREMVNETAAEALNLPANATSIRENITDTFSCENRTYGYYADVDNECQLFHVCLPSQSVTGRNITYKFSFICPKETVFNQEVLVCTRPRDSIPCEESPDFYDLNMEIGKIVDPDANKEDVEENTNKQTESIPVKQNVNIKKQDRNKNRKKQNIIMDALLKEAEEQMEEFEELNETPLKTEVPVTEIDSPYDATMKTETAKNKPDSFRIDAIQNEPEIKEIEKKEQQPGIKIETTQYQPQLEIGINQYGPDINQSAVGLTQTKPEMKIEPVLYEPENKYETNEYKSYVPKYKEDFENTRLGVERSMKKRTGRKIWRGSAKYKSIKH